MRSLNNNRNILGISLILLVVFGCAIFFIGKIIKRIADEMNNTIAVQSCRNHFEETSFEFFKTAQAGEIAIDFIANHRQLEDAEFATLSSTMLKLDPKIGRVWLLCKSSGMVRNYCRTSHEITNTSTDLLQCQIVEEHSDTTNIFRQIYRADEQLCWSSAYDVRDDSGNDYILGVDIYLNDLYQEFVNRSQRVKSYITVVDRRGVILLHPDSLLQGATLADDSEQQTLRHVLATGKEDQRTVVSEYLGLPVERIYYPLSIGRQQWIVITNIPHISMNENMSNFNRYTLFVALIAVVLFSVLLWLSQARWRREYHLRRKAEQESLKLQLQQIVDQINPHFLFNSLNSLYVLIDKNTDLAREFVLSLSKVYRTVLESGRDVLSPVDKEIEFVREYYFLQKIRFNEQIDLRIDIDKELGAYRLPTMSIETVVENAIKHNKITPDNPLKITIYIREMSLIIENNYTPRHDSEVESFGVGLERIHSIYRLYTSDQMVVDCDGKSFRCELPLLS